MNKYLALFEGILFIFILYLFSITNTPSSSQVYAQSCQTPATVTGVTVTYPDCNDTNCSFTQANCTWDQISGAASYTVKVTEVDSGTVVQNTTLSSSSTKTIFAVTSGKTYKCDITAVNSCGQSGGTGTDSLLCQVEGAVTPTPQPTSTPIPTTPPRPTNTPRPTLPPTGAQENMIIAGVVTIFFVMVGLSLFVL